MINYVYVIYSKIGIEKYCLILIDQILRPRMNIPPNLLSTPPPYIPDKMSNESGRQGSFDEHPSSSVIVSDVD